MEEGAVIVRNLAKKYKGDILALKGVSMNVPQNSIYGLLGSNGAGKSTLMHILTGLLSYDSGELFILGQKMETNSEFFKRKIAIVPQKLSLYEDLSIYDNIYFFGKTYGLKKREIQARINNLAEVLKLENLNRKIKNLSGGYKRRVSLAIALIGDPELIILDEALVGIDLETKDIIVDLLLDLKQTKTILITTHSIREAERICDYMCFLHGGVNLIEGKTRDIIKKYSRGEKVIIEITMDVEESAINLIEKMEGLKLEKEVHGRNIKITFRYGEYNIVELVEHLAGLTENVYDIEDLKIKTPGLEEVILKLMRS